MKRHIVLPLVALMICLGPMAAAQQLWSGEMETLSENAEREARRILSQDLFGHYDIVRIQVLNVEGVGRQLGRDYGLVKVALEFSTRRNGTRNPSLSPAAFEAGGCTPAKVPTWFYLHCGVPAGHVFDGEMELLLVVGGNPDRWTAVSPNWRTLQSYPLQGYLILEGKQKEGYVLFPGEDGR